MIIMIVNAIGTPLVFFFDIIYIWQEFKKYFYTKNYQKKYQYELNSVYDGFEFEISEYFACIFKNISLTLFYLPIVPFGPILSLVELILSYLVWKWIFIKRARVPKEMDIKFLFLVDEVYVRILSLVSLGYLMFDLVLLGKINMITYFMLGLSLLFLLPLRKFIRKYF